MTAKTKRGKILKIVLGILLAAAVVTATVMLLPYVLRLREESVREAFRDRIDSFGIWGFAVMLLLQAAQVIFAVIPGEPVEILMGMLYGTVGGLGLCMLGVLIGSAAIYFLVWRLGRAGIEKMMNSEKYRKFRFLRDPVKRDSLLFLLYVIPGTPKDLLTYFAPCTGIRPLRFLVICTFSRIPSVISSTYLGASILDGNIWISVAVFAATALIGLLGIWFNDRFLAKCNAENAVETPASEPPHEEQGK